MAACRATKLQLNHIRYIRNNQIENDILQLNDILEDTSIIVGVANYVAVRDIHAGAISCSLLI